jgi:hypothetical protein
MQFRAAREELLIVEIALVLDVCSKPIMIQQLELLEVVTTSFAGELVMFSAILLRRGSV